MNTLAGHPLVPPVRVAIYRGMGLDVRTRRIFEGCSFVGRGITIGANTYVNREVLLQAEPSARITIGANCHIAMRVVVHHLPVTIGDRLRLGSVRSSSRA